MSGIGRASPVFAVRELEAALAFYERLGFAVRQYDAGYGYAERDALRLHLREPVEDKPCGVREFGLRDLDNNHLRFGRQTL